MEKNKNLHLLWRCGFGPDISGIEEIEKATAKQLWERIKKNALKPLSELTFSNSFVQDNYDKITERRLRKDEKEEWTRRIRLQSAKDVRELNTKWIRLMIESPNQLAERMSFFWHHHFAIRHANSFLQQDAINVIRKYALGNFGNLLREVSKSGAMILSLNNQQNRKTSPNENFAREIMELFAMGIGSYTEKDIKEAARAFTGWSIGRDGRFAFKSEDHDTSTKNVLGQSGRFDGDDVVDIILKHPQTAVFIVTKIYRYFVNENADTDKIEQLAASFRKNYDILQLMDAIFGSDWFYQQQNMNNRIKSPIDLLVGLQRLSPIASIDMQLQNSIQKLLGQVLFHPPSIAGWSSGKNWLDSSTLMVRLQLPQIVSGKVAINIRTKSDDDTNMGRSNPDDVVRLQGRGGAILNPQFTNWSAKTNEAIIASYVAVPAINGETLALLENNSGKDKAEFTYSLMNLPEYQLC